MGAGGNGTEKPMGLAFAYTGLGHLKVSIALSGVKWTCAITGDEITSDIEITYTPRGALLEYTALQRLIDETARSRTWTAEELADSLAALLAAHLEAARNGGQPPCVKVAIRFPEGERMRIAVKAVYPKDCA